MITNISFGAQPDAAHSCDLFSVSPVKERAVINPDGTLNPDYSDVRPDFLSSDEERVQYMIDHSKGGAVPKCEKCGGPVKPDVVLYEEGLNMTTLNRAVDAITNADVLIIGGTSLVVYPAAGLIDYYQGHKLVLINKSATSRDSQADLVISDSIGKVLGSLD